MPKGGRRKGTRTPTWNTGKTTTIRIPVALKEEVLQLVRTLDELDSKGQLIDEETYIKIIEILQYSLTLPANKGGAIKEQIKEVLALLEQ